jgi:hypothetical protein
MSMEVRERPKPALKISKLRERDSPFCLDSARHHGSDVDML